MKSKDSLSAEQQVLAMLDRGWRWRDPLSSVLVHPQDYSLFVVYDQQAGTLTCSAELLKALDLIIPTPPHQSRYYWPDEQRAYLRSKRR
ncbi:hypothetical protein R5W24_005260 [Gemmata sp. JC717]|uniref:hypothetical protein n=1 Tax=Gemmata algarum TaxID=2975278 RepID=UPI0021BB0098|nr:hypothetical protein [Gemmata algarum]MDY3556097.1 hypothetical protein [Gemmata algarum]